MRHLKYIVTSVLSALFISGNSHATLILDSNFESGSLAPWSTHGNANATIVTSPGACSGQKSVKQSIVHNSGTEDYRSELGLERNYPDLQFEVDGEYWIGFAIYLPNGYATDYSQEIVLQFHGRPDKDLNEAYRNPPLALTVKNGDWNLYTRWDSRLVQFENGEAASYEGATETKIAKVETGKWTTFVWHIKFSYIGKGLVDIWKDGEKIHSYTKGNSYNDKRPLYLHAGIYKSDWKYDRPVTAVSSRTLYLDEIKIAGSNSSYSEVAPACASGAPAVLAPPSPPSSIIAQ